MIENRLNNRPCKRLGFRTPAEVFHKLKTSMRAGSKHCNKQGMRPRAGNRTTTRSGHIAALEGFHLLSSPTFIGSEQPMKVNPSIQI
jgi:hypothetical protein